MQVEAYRGTIIMPNRHEESTGSMFEGHLVASETYVGGHVEALEAGVFRSDIPTHFKVDKAAIQQVSYLSNVLHYELMSWIVD
jgi:DNA polymerase epsilon subunit 1